MKQCKQCDNEVMGKQVYCSDKCRKAASRTTRTDKSDICPDKPNSDNQVGQVADSPNIAKVRGTGQGIPNFGQSDCQCKHCQNNRAGGSKLTLNHGKYKTADELGEHEGNRVSLPGDPDYENLQIDWIHPHNFGATQGVG